MIIHKSSVFQQIAKLARSLRVTGDFPENPSKANKPKNELFDKPKSVEEDYSKELEDEDDEDDDDQLESELEKTEESAEAVTNPDEDDEFAGGLC